VFRSKHRESNKTETSSSTKKDISSSTVDNSVITTQETVDTVVKTLPQNFEQNSWFDLRALKKGITLMSNDFFDIRQELDTTSNLLKTHINLKGREIPVKSNKKTTNQKNVTSNTKEKLDQQLDEKKEQKRLDVKVEKKVNLWAIAVITVALIIVISVLIILYKNKSRIFKKL